MTNAETRQVQNVLDAAVVNPVVQQEYADLVRRSVVAQHGMVVQRDQKIVRKASKVFEQQIQISATDKRILLDFELLLASDAFDLTTNNPDEAAFMGNLRGFLEEKGVWLRFEPKSVRDPENPSSRIIDPRSFEAWLSLGAGGDQIPAGTGLLTRKALLGTKTIGAAYYREVHRGPYMQKLDKFMASLFEEIQDGQQENLRQSGVRSGAMPGVPAISDAFGKPNLPSPDNWNKEALESYRGAAAKGSFPSPKSWDKAWELYHHAWKQRNSGNVLGAVSTLVAAAILTEILATKLADYIDRTTEGAGKVLTFIEIVETVRKIAELLMLAKAAGTALIRYWAGRSAAGASATQVAKNRSQAASQKTQYDGHTAHQRTDMAKPKPLARQDTHYDGTMAHAKTNVTMPNTGAGGPISPREADFLRKGEGWFQDTTKWLMDNPNASLADKLTALEKFEKKWGFNPSAT